MSHFAWRTSFAALFSGGQIRSPVSQIYEANAMRLQTDNSAKPVDFCPPHFPRTVIGCTASSMKHARPLPSTTPNSPTHLQLSNFASLKGACWASTEKSKVYQRARRHHRTLRLLSCCRIDDRPNSRDSIGRKTALLGVFTQGIFIGGHVDAVDFVVRDVALNPLNLSTHLS